jgi:hypothetical protein
MSVDYEENHPSGSYYADGELSFSDKKNSTGYDYLHLQGKGNIVVSPNIIELNSVSNYDLNLYLPESCGEIEIEVRREGDSPQGEIINFGTRDLLALGARLLEVDDWDRSQLKRDVVSIQENQGEVWSLINFVNKLSEFMDLSTYIEAVVKITDNYYEVRNRRESIFETLLKRLVLGNMPNGDFRLENHSELSAIAGDLAREFKDTSIDVSNSLDWALQELDERQEAKKITKLMVDFDIIQRYPDLTEERLVLLVIANQSLAGNRSQVRDIVTRYFREDYGNFDQSAYDSMKNAIWETEEEEEKVEKWKRLLGYGSSHVDDREFSFVLASTLSRIADRRNDQAPYYHTVPVLYEASSELFSDIDHQHDQRCEFESYHRRGLLLYHSGSYRQSSDLFTSAIEVATNDSGEYSDVRTGWLPDPLIYKSLADAQVLTQEGNEEKAVKLLEERSNIADSFQVIHENGRGRILSAIEGRRFRIQADILLRNGEYERALETIGRAIGQLKQGDLDRAAENALQRKEEISAVYNESVGNFERAAQMHETLSDKDSFSPSRQTVHQVRAYLCQAKRLTLAGEYETAVEKIRQISQNTSSLESDSLEIGTLLNLLQNYREGKVDYAARTFEKLTVERRQSQQENPLALEYDYTECIVVILALQRLRSTNISEGLLNSFLEVTLDRAFTPQQKGDVSEELYLGDISVDRLWRERLPTPVLNRVEGIMCQKITTAGDYKAPTLLLAELVEFYLALLVEYHGKHEWQDTWRSELAEEHEDENNLSIGILSRIFEKEAAEEMLNANELNEIYFSNRAGFDNMTEMRNHFDHGYQGEVDRSTFNRLNDWVFNFLRTSVKDVPLIIHISDRSAMGFYSGRLQWWRGLRQIMIDTDTSLELDAYYYIPSEVILGSLGQIVHEVDKEQLIKVDDPRVIKQLAELRESGE